MAVGEGATAPFTRAAEQFAAVAACLEQRMPDEALMARIADATAQCRRIAAEAPDAAQQAILGNMATVFDTWQSVWPRLGAQPEFRQAVEREARLWAKRLPTLAAPHG